MSEIIAISREELRQFGEDIVRKTVRMMNEQPDWMTRVQAAKYLGCSRS